MDSSSQSSCPWNYEASVAQVESLIASLESGESPLETVFEEFEVAIQEIYRCEQFLNQGIERMNLLIETLEDDVEF